MSRRLVVALLALAALAAGSAASFAYLATGTTAGSAGRAVAGGMSAPSAVAAELDVAGADDVTVTWGAATVDGRPVQHYTVKRGATTVCANVTDANRTCADANVAPGAHTYTVTAVYEGWTTQAADGVTVQQQDTTGPAVTLEQAAAQADPTKTLPITFTVQFDEDVSGFDRTDVTRGGTANPALDNITVTPNSPRSYTVTVDDTPTLASGTVVLSIAAGAAHDAAGNGNSPSTGDGSVGYDIVGPRHALTLFGTSTGAYLTPAGTTLFYRGQFAGSFRLADAATDALSTVASVTYPAIAAGLGWTHTTAETVGAPFVSSTYSWQGNAGHPGSMTVTALDALGNQSAANVLFSIDNVAPVNGSIGYAKTPRNVASVPIALTNGTDAASGIASHRLQRRSSAITAGACGTPGAFADVATNPAASYSDTGVSHGNCYEYQYVITDNVGIAVTRTDGTGAVAIDTAAPVLSGMTASNRNGALGNNDRLTFAYADAAGLGVDPASVIAGWDGSAQSVSVTLTDGAAGASDTMTVPGIGTVNLGSGSWLGSSSTQSASLQMTSLNTFELRISGAVAGSTSNNAASSFTWSAASGTAKDKAGNAAAGSVTTSNLQF